mmetsp:Transcript_73265/g.238316  ORF Transcript_73265/g.238316 Transcript_73265/m.238316 type:complete len:308 (+) Transcript_73265:71-994(+)
MEDLRELIKGKPVAIVIDADSADLDVLLWSEGWLTNSKGTMLIGLLGEVAFQNLVNWVLLFLERVTALGWSLSRSAALYQRMILQAQDSMWYKVRLMVHLPEASLLTQPRSVRPVVLSMERMKPARNPWQNSGMANLRSIAEMPQAAKECVAPAASEQRLWGSSADVLLQEWGDDLDSSASTWSSEKSSSEGSFGSEEASDTHGRLCDTLVASGMLVGATAVHSFQQAATTHHKSPATRMLAWPGDEAYATHGRPYDSGMLVGATAGHSLRKATTTDHTSLASPTLACPKQSMTVERPRATALTLGS